VRRKVSASATAASDLAPVTTVEPNEASRKARLSYWTSPLTLIEARASKP
jgi:hypothetical protein